MNSPAHVLSVWTMITCLTMGLANPLGIGPRFLPPSWSALYGLLPGADWAYPGAYVVNGMFALAGVWSPVALRVSCWMTFGLFLVWGAVGLYLTIQGMPGGNVQGSFANFLTAGQAFVLAYYVTVGVRGDRINRKVERLAEQVRDEGVERGPTPT